MYGNLFYAITTGNSVHLKEEYEQKQYQIYSNMMNTTGSFVWISKWKWLIFFIPITQRINKTVLCACKIAECTMIIEHGLSEYGQKNTMS